MARHGFCADLAWQRVALRETLKFLGLGAVVSVVTPGCGIMIHNCNATGRLQARTISGIARKADRRRSPLALLGRVVVEVFEDGQLQSCASVPAVVVVQAHGVADPDVDVGAVVAEVVERDVAKGRRCPS
ncbi:MAG TPA: hypothetical protein VK501_11585 [Baekduia sp.]|uniref:hypothetical protein n=1 Tax=Baekduia sp. TaxID=2600305 RepID=UPI002CFD6DEE|nr:hypothetical protein [Baekduia sp.]HMJ34549.1 hypothetical protein [Baekduia sp.]